MEGKGITASWRTLEYYLLSRRFLPTHFHGNRFLYLLFIYEKLWPTIQQEAKELITIMKYTRRIRISQRQPSLPLPITLSGSVVVTLTLSCYNDFYNIPIARQLSC